MPSQPSESSREQRLQAVLVACVEALEKGQALDKNELLARYPEFAAELAEFLAGRAHIEHAAEPLRALAPGALGSPLLGASSSPPSPTRQARAEQAAAVEGPT